MPNEFELIFADDLSIHCEICGKTATTTLDFFTGFSTEANLHSNNIRQFLNSCPPYSQERVFVVSLPISLSPRYTRQTTEKSSASVSHRQRLTLISALADTADLLRRKPRPGAPVAAAADGGGTGGQQTDGGSALCLSADELRTVNRRARASQRSLELSIADNGRERAEKARPKNATCSLPAIHCYSVHLMKHALICFKKLSIYPRGKGPLCRPHISNIFYSNFTHLKLGNNACEL